MILKSIELNDFMCYAGPNRFAFTEGINLIIGDNGYGKSKLFDAFYWVMYDQLFDTSRKEFRETRFLKKQIISDKALHEADEGMVTASVLISLQNDRGHEFELERRYSVRKLIDGVKEDETSEFIIRKKEMEFLTASIVSDPDDIERIKALVLPSNIKPYMWFQGEQVESIIDFNKDASLTQAINVLSNISRYDRIVDLSNSLKESADKEYNKKVRELSKDRVRSEELEAERKKLVETIEYHSAQVNKLKDNLATAEERSEALLQRVVTAEQIRDHAYKQEQAQEKLVEVTNDLNDELTFFHKRLFTSKWVLKGTEGLFEAYSAKYGAYDRRKLEMQAELKARLEQEDQLRKTMQTRLPIDVPEPIHVERMLEEERCLVCDRPAEKGTEAWNKMKELLDRSKSEIKTLEEEALTKHDFGPELKRLYNNGLSLQPTIRGVDQDIANTRRTIKKFDTRSKDLRRELEKLKAAIEGLISDSTLDVESARNLTHEFGAQKDNIVRFTRESSTLDSGIAQKRKELSSINEQLQSLVTGELPAFLQEKVEVLGDFQSVAVSTRKRVFKQLVAMLEAEANKHYNDMTQGNMSARGIIHLKELANGNYMPELVDDQGNPLMNLNTGNIILIKLATIMAIISARQGTRSTDLYTLITDAPMSVFGEDYTLGFCKTVSKVYRQSIIMSKEFYKNLALREQLLADKDIKLGKVYMIEPTIPETERSNRNSLATRITSLN
jgi:DNA sulfur modification protein DndD